MGTEQGPSERGSASIPRWLRVVFGLPVGLYRRDLGWLLGRRALLLEHVGRVSGKPRQTVLEVIGYDAVTREATVVSGWGEKADWLRNITANGKARITIARDTYTAAWRRLPTDEAVDMLASYEARHWLIAPIVRRVLSALLGWRYDGSPASRRRAVQQLPILTFHPAEPGQPSRM